MNFYSKENKPFGYIVYSRYGCMSHIIMNEHGVVFGVNPLLVNFADNYSKVVIFDTKEDAEMAKDSFYDNISAVILISKFEADSFTHFK